MSDKMAAGRELIFQSTLPQGERQQDRRRTGRGKRISIHAPTRGATESSGIQTATGVISIHAPTRGATTPRAYKEITEYISIHAPTRGATRFSPRRFSKYSRFQSTLPQGERRKGRPCLHHQRYFNPRSHKGSDLVAPDNCIIQKHFNPRSHKGSDQGPRGRIKKSRKFQSTLPQGERRRRL